MKHEEKQTFIKDQEIRITEFYQYNVPSFKAITFTGNRTLPTGSVSIYGYINSNKKLSFSATISLGSGEKNFEADGGFTDELDQLMRKDVKTVSQIEKIKKEQK
ncbi:DUF1433 domain-containing protein [Sporolactobacillus shoreae]|uniref:DUF1433 domain-containing protein n=1 Tax=Sporolactobacillus shoreae TaxID=1465501 RepID=A0A4Z0GLB1_9BACL|nr:DUF1433 domain-containing protein [Sporolactobacillus shoreae]TGA96575.1 DUF1433 domain-containing protein [Sporolactobacillus shoreae]